MASSRIAVIGAGLMGHGIALTMARAGHEVRISDPAEEIRASVLDRVSASLLTLGVSAAEMPDVIARIHPTAEIANAVDATAFVFEAAPEKLALKQHIFAEVEAHAPPTAILASNTSVIQITKIMNHLQRRERALGTHWWNPPHMIPLVEVIRTEATSEDSMEAMVALLANAGKTPVRVEKDVPGFIGNRLQHALWREAVSLVENGICDAEACDTVIKSSFGRRLAVLGPLENADLVGTDLTLDIHRNVLFDLDRQADASPFLQRLVEDGKLGMKTGEGFHHWTQQEADAVRERVARHLTKLETMLGK